MEAPEQQRREYFAEPSLGPERELEIREVLRRLWGYKWLLSAIFILVVGTAWVMGEQIVPRYTATAVLLIEPSEKNVIELRDVVKGLDTRPQTLRTEVIVLQSKELVAKVAEQLRLYDSPRFHSPREQKSFFAHLNPSKYLPKDWMDKIGDFWRDAKASVIGQPPPVSAPLSETEIEKSQRNGTVNSLLAGLTVAREEFTRVIRISFTFANPKLTAEAANTLADVYVQNTLDVKYAGTREAAQWLNEQLAELRQRVEESEAAVEQIRQGEALVQGRSTQLVSDQISALNGQLIEAKAKTDRLKGRLSQIEELRRSPNWEEHSTPMLESDLVQALRLEKFKLEREAAELSNRYGKRHPKIMNISGEIADVQSRIRSEIE